MYHSPAKYGYYVIDGQKTWCDSKTEATILQQLAENGFSGKWRRPRHGVAYGKRQYTPDAELYVLWNGEPRRIFVEFKSQSAKEFTRREHALTALHKYGNNQILLLYVHKTKRWYHVQRNKPLTQINMPIPAPGPLPTQQWQFTHTFVNRYGRKYSSLTTIDALNGALDSIVKILQDLFLNQAKSQKRRRNHKK